MAGDQLDAGARPVARWQRAGALVTLILFSTASPALLVGAGAGTGGPSAGEPPASALAGRADPAVPDEPVRVPASVSSPRATDPRGEGGSVKREVVAAAATPGGIPAVALTAYRRAEAVINAADRTCGLTWPLLAAIGRVESDHGRYGGSGLDPEGVARPAIVGIPLDGSRGTARILDTDGGRLDADEHYDRAVGPMQFIPSTWALVGLDGDDDGTRDPQDVDDAALASAVYLCSGPEALDEEEGLRAAVHRYNRSRSYVDLVLSLMEGYSSGSFSEPTGASVPTARPVGPGDRGGRSPEEGPTTGRDPSATAAAQALGEPRTQGPREGAQEPRKPRGPRSSPPTAPPVGPPSGPPASPPEQSPPSATPSDPPTTGARVPLSALPGPGGGFGAVLTYAAARDQCLARGVPADAPQRLDECVRALLAP